MAAVPAADAEPPRDCPLCPRLHDFIALWRGREPDWHNAPVPTLADARGDRNVRLLVVGLAPGLRGANRTGRPFTGDYAGDLLYATLKDFGFAQGRFEARPDDSLELTGAAVTNAVRCVPPENKPVGAEINTCRQFLRATIGRFENLQAVAETAKAPKDGEARTAAVPSDLSPRDPLKVAEAIENAKGLDGMSNGQRDRIATGLIEGQCVAKVLADTFGRAPAVALRDLIRALESDC